MTVEIANNVPAGLSNSVTGETVNAYADALDWPCLGVHSKAIHLKNTHATRALKYQVLTYAHAGGVDYEEVAETSLAALDTAQIILLYPYAAVRVQVKSSSLNTPATYQVDHDGDD